MSSNKAKLTRAEAEAAGKVRKPPVQVDRTKRSKRKAVVSKDLFLDVLSRDLIDSLGVCFKQKAKDGKGKDVYRQSKDLFWILFKRIEILSTVIPAVSGTRALSLSGVASYSFREVGAYSDELHLVPKLQYSKTILDYWKSHQDKIKEGDIDPEQLYADMLKVMEEIYPIKNKGTAEGDSQTKNKALKGTNISDIEFI
ncbi:MAG: hypothetical protein LBQ77_00280 [Treponema sp.]|jgi:hypothetical protein|nr:hypothetical protein [Treponema sp.]